MEVTSGCRTVAFVQQNAQLAVCLNDAESNRLNVGDVLQTQLFSDFVDAQPETADFQLIHFAVFNDNARFSADDSPQKRAGDSHNGA